MPFGTLFTTEENSRSIAIKAIAKANGLELNIVHATLGNPTPEHLAVNKLGRIPTFVDEDGFVLSECMAVALYFTSQDEDTKLLGSTKKEYASIVRWMSFFNTEIVIPLAAWFRPIAGKDPYNEEAVKKASTAVLKAVKTVEGHLEDKDFLVGNAFTLADLFCAGLLFRGFQHFFDKPWRSEHPNISRWYEDITNRDIYTAVAPKKVYLDEAKRHE